MQKLEVCTRYFRWDNGEPFFYLGDTAWEIIHKLSREEIQLYLKVRACQGFTAVQTVALAEKDGLRVPNAYGRLPLKADPESGLPDPVRPDTDGDYSYWDHTDFIIDEAAACGIVVTLLPTWGDKFMPLWGKGPKIFTPDNAYIYGKWIAQRYADRWNIIWMLGGDRPIDDENRIIIDAMARGIKENDKVHLITYHPVGHGKSTDYLHDAEYIDFNTAQTGHDEGQCYQSDTEMKKMAEASQKPYMDSEPRYEDHPACFDPSLGIYWSAADVRQNAYWDVFAGACGHTYGNHAMWSCNTEPCDYTPYSWQEVLRHPGAEQMKWLKHLRMRGDFMSFRSAPEILADEYTGCGHLSAACGSGYAYVYTPLGMHFTVHLNKAVTDAKRLRAIWFDPRSGKETTFGIYPVRGDSLFVPPTRGTGEDWVLILESV